VHPWRHLVAGGFNEKCALWPHRYTVIRGARCWLPSRMVIEQPNCSPKILIKSAVQQCPQLWCPKSAPPHSWHPFCPSPGLPFTAVRVFLVRLVGFDSTFSNRSNSDPQTQSLPAHGTEAKRRVDSTTGQHLKTHEVASGRHLRVVTVADLIQGYLNGQLLLDRRDSRFQLSPSRSLDKIL